MGFNSCYLFLLSGLRKNPKMHAWGEVLARTRLAQFSTLPANCIKINELAHTSRIIPILLDTPFVS